MTQNELSCKTFVKNKLRENDYNTEEGLSPKRLLIFSFLTLLRVFSNFCTWKWTCGQNIFSFEWFRRILVFTQRQKPTRKWPLGQRNISLLDITISKSDSNIQYFVFSQLQTRRSFGYFGEMILDHSTRVYQKLNPFSYWSSDFSFVSRRCCCVFIIVLLRDSFPSSYLCQTDTWSVYITALIAYPEYVESAVNITDTFHYKEKGTVEPWFNAPLYNERYSSPPQWW